MDSVGSMHGRDICDYHFMPNASDESTIVRCSYFLHHDGPHSFEPLAAKDWADNKARELLPCTSNGLPVALTTCIVVSNDSSDHETGCAVHRRVAVAAALRSASHRQETEDARGVGGS